MQPTPRVSRADVERIIRRDFPDTDVARVFEILDAYGTEQWEGGCDRVHLAALKLAGGSIEELQRHVATAKLDPRDVIAAAEYPLAITQWPPPAHARPAEEQQQTYAADWDQYRRWLEQQ